MIQIILYSLCFYVVASSPLWPLPVDSSLGSQSISLSNDFSFVQSAGKSALLDRAITRYVNLIKPSSIENQLNINFCNVHVNQLFENEEQTLLPGVDESYQLIVTTNGECTISSETIWGAMHAMESFTQLLERESNSVVLKYAPVSISDNCRFTHRGLMVDSSRHYLPVNALERIIDTLPMNKFNVLHWHMVDAQSFPVDTPSAPQMIQGAYDSSLVYSMDDIKSLTQYAYDRGVRLLLEVDIPGHAASWTNGYPQIMADCFAKYYYNINDFALNPVLEETYEVVEKVLSDIISVSGAKYFHIGGDEVVYGCWKEDKSITEYMSANNIASYDDLLGYFVLRVDEIVRKLGATPVHWEEVFKAGVDVAPDTVFEVWTAQSQMASIAAANYSIISAPSDVWYLDHADNSWSVMYNYDPTSSLTAAQVPLVLGGEVCMWGEHVDENNIESIVYPRASAVGERLWSEAEVKDSSAAHDRFNIQRCRMIARGFHPSAIEPGYCAKKLV